MNKSLFLFIVGASFILVLFSCQKEEALKKNEEYSAPTQPFIPGSGGGSGGSGGGSSAPEYFDFEVDGVLFSQSSPFYQGSTGFASVVSVLGATNFINMGLLGSPVSFPDTTDLSFFPVVSFVKSSSEIYDAEKGYLILTEETSAKVVGTFSFVGFQSVSDSVVVSNGSFSVNK